MKLYIKAGACSLATDIVLREAGMTFDLVPVDLATKTLADGASYLAISPKGQVPALQLDDGSLLTENPVILQWAADQAPQANLLPASGLARYQALAWLNFVSGEIHKNFTPLFKPNTPADYRVIAAENVLAKLVVVNDQLGKTPYLAGDSLTPADIYLWVTLNWTKMVNLDTSALTNLPAFQARIAARPAVQEALQAEGLK